MGSVPVASSSAGTWRGSAVGSACGTGPIRSWCRRAAAHRCCSALRRATRGLYRKDQLCWVSQGWQLMDMSSSIPSVEYLITASPVANQPFDLSGLSHQLVDLCPGVGPFPRSHTVPPGWVVFSRRMPAARAVTATDTPPGDGGAFASLASPLGRRRASGGGMRLAHGVAVAI
jgi:hypothetical protein